MTPTNPSTDHPVTEKPATDEAKKANLAADKPTAEKQSFKQPRGDVKTDKSATDKAPTDKAELRARVAARKAKLEADLASIKAGAPDGTSTVVPNAIASHLASLESLMGNSTVISETTAAELSRWLDATEHVSVGKIH